VTAFLVVSGVILGMAAVVRLVGRACPICDSRSCHDYPSVCQMKRDYRRLYGQMGNDRESK
jgi:hypothetical protein